MAAARLATAELATGGALSLRWADGLRRSFHPRWLRDNCPSGRHPGNRQKLVSVAELPEGLAVAEATAETDTLRVTWRPDGHVSEFCAHWLRTYGSAVPIEYESAPPLPAYAAAGRQPLPTRATFEYAELREAGGGGASWDWISALADNGAVLVRDVPSQTPDGTDGVPDGTDGVRAVAQLIGPLQPNIYGETFDVRWEENATNLAYTAEELAPHMDLVYYESPPGLQLLHCLEFDGDIEGGETFVLDGLAVCERLRRSDPEAFETLRTVPATFLKDHSKRADPVCMSYQRPHIATDGSGRVVGLFWAPPFEGPLRDVAFETYDRYYSAYRVLHKAIAAAPRWEAKLAKGEVLVFNNRRMLHGRRAFRAASGGTRHLRGCYVCIDEYADTSSMDTYHGTE